MNYTRFATGEFDVDIVYGRPQIEGTVVLPLGEKTVTPLCLPKFASLIRRPENLFNHTLIDSDNKPVHWPDWFAANGLSPPPTRGMRFDRSFLAISAAAHGLGWHSNRHACRIRDCKRAACSNPQLAVG